jgi:hypothetical protein
MKMNFSASAAMVSGLTIMLMFAARIVHMGKPWLIASLPHSLEVSTVTMTASNLIYIDKVLQQYLLITRGEQKILTI